MSTDSQTRTAPPVIMTWPNPVLRTKAIDVPTEGLRDNKEVMEVLTLMDAALREAKWGNRLGLAANQVGSSMNIAVVLGRVCFNPKFTPPKSCPKNVVVEGCYSSDGQYKVERWPYGWCEWHDIDGNLHKTKENGLFGWVMQHEVSHLDGHSIEEYGTKL